MLSLSCHEEKLLQIYEPFAGGYMHWFYLSSQKSSFSQYFTRGFWLIISTWLEESWKTFFLLLDLEALIAC